MQGQSEQSWVDHRTNKNLSNVDKYHASNREKYMTSQCLDRTKANLSCSCTQSRILKDVGLICTYLSSCWTNLHSFVLLLQPITKFTSAEIFAPICQVVAPNYTIYKCWDNLHLHVKLLYPITQLQNVRLICTHPPCYCMVSTIYFLLHVIPCYAYPW